MLHESSRVAARFDGWVLLRAPLELLHDGQKVRVQEQPLQILEAVVGRPGQLVKREELIAKLWPRGITDFDAGLNTAMRKLRAVLDDDPDSPRYIETVPRQGYRFVGTLATEMPGVPDADPAIAGRPVADSPGSDSKDADMPAAAPRRRRLFAAVIALGAAVFAVAVYRGNRPAAPEAAAIPRVAVLPFENLSADPTNAFFADAMHEEILRSLATAPDLDVVSRTTMMLYRKSPKSVPQIVTDLGASHVLEGTVRRDAEDVRVTVQLIDAANDKPLWSRSFDRKLANVMTLQAEIAGEVARQLATQLSRSDARLPPSKNPAAYDLWLMGVLAWQDVGAGGATKQEVLRVKALYTRAIELDPSYAAAYADRCRVQIAMFTAGTDTSEENIAGARADLAVAQKLAGQTTHVLMRSAALAYLIDGELERALTLIAAAEKAGPLEPDHMMTKAVFLAVARRLDEALATFALATKLDPANPAIVRFRTVHLFAARRPADALRAVRALDERMPGRVDRGEFLFAFTGSTARWRTEVDRMQEMPQPNFWLSNEFDLMRIEGRLDDLRTLLANTSLTEFRRHTSSRNLIGSSMNPVAQLRGWERLLSGDRAGAASQAAIVLRFVEGQKRRKWNAWALHMLTAEGALFGGERDRAIAEARQAIGAIGTTSNLAVTVHGRMMAARVFAWAGAREEALDLLERLPDSYPGIGPAAIARDPLLSVPLAGHARWQALVSALEAEIANNQTLL
jgi:TolB-like protein/DNA-binding winged helix-turn-helix (wHTH) protein